MKSGVFRSLSQKSHNSKKGYETRLSQKSQNILYFETFETTTFLEGFVTQKSRKNVVPPGRVSTARFAEPCPRPLPCRSSPKRGKTRLPDPGLEKPCPSGPARPTTSFGGKLPPIDPDRIHGRGKGASSKNHHEPENHRKHPVHRHD